MFVFAFGRPQVALCIWVGESVSPHGIRTNCHGVINILYCNEQQNVQYSCSGLEVSPFRYNVV